MCSSSHINIRNLLKKGDILLCIILYLLIKLNCFGYTGWIRWYGNDIIAGYIFCYITQKLYQKILNKNLNKRIQFKLLISASVYWEYIYPQISKISTTDIYDVGAYIAGYVIFIIIEFIIKKHTV